MPAESTRAALFARYTQDYPATEELFLTMGGLPFLRAHQFPPLAKELRAYFAPFLCAPSPADICGHGPANPGAGPGACLRRQATRSGQDQDQGRMGGY